MNTAQKRKAANKACAEAIASAWKAYEEARASAMKEERDNG